jgi:signal transduction histidine kinase
VDRALEQLEPHAVRLNAALLFNSVRESATSEERLRLAREVHDGVAQDVASLGYLIDNIAVTATDPDQVADVARLRKEVSRVVAELRNSVFDLRNEVGATQGLGQSLASFARQVGSHSDLTVHVTLDESTVRLRPKVEAELLRMAQEAINNARRHSGGQNLWVDCRVRPPRAEITVVDDGDGLGTGREDSQGLKIMRERADRIGADLVVESPAQDGKGTRVSIRLD